MIVTLAVGVFLFVRLLFPEEEAQEAKKRLGVGGVRTVAPSLVIKISRPLFVLLTPMTQNLKAERYRTRIRRGFITAGMTDEMSPDEFFAWKMVMAVFAPVFIGQMIGGIFNIPWWFYLITGIVGFFYPDIWLDGRVKARQRLILRQMPYVMDLLTLSVEAGLDFVSGIAKVVEKAKPGPLIEELSFYLHEIQVGTTRAQALRNFAYRINMPQTSSFSALLIQADQLGASIGPVLRAQSDLLRTQRFQAAEKAGAAATQKLLFPLVICIMPAVFIMIFGPILLNFIYGKGVIGPDKG
ncbi:MAG TPA: type II secretion system F family protein [bacterium]|nr:type II secretion system F family protein [bacterium]